MRAGRLIAIRMLATAAVAVVAFSEGPVRAQAQTEREVLLSTLSPEGVERYHEALGASRLTDMNRFDISVVLDPEKDTLSGRVEMSVKNTSSATLSDIVLRLWPNAMVKGERRMKLMDVAFRHQRMEFAEESDSIVRVKLPAPVRPGERFEVEARFTSWIPAIGGDQLNLYAQAVEQLFQMLSDKEAKPGSADYGIFATDGTVFNLGGFYPVPATLGRGGWEAEESNGIGDFSYGPPSNYFVAVRTPPDFVVATPGRELKKSPTGATVTHYIVAAAARDFVIEASRAFKTASDSAEGIEITAFYTGGNEEGAQRMLQVAKDTLTFYSRKFGPYPYREFKTVAAPITGGAGGVEFPGLVTIAGMLMHPPHGEGKAGKLDFGSMAASSSLTAELLDFVVAHEVAHQWWSSLVGSDPRRYPYVDEGMASYSAVMYFEELFGKQKGRHMLDTQVRMNYQMMRLFGGKDMPIETPVSQYKSMIDYAGIVYGKAPLYHNAIREMIGPKAWMEACREYALKYGFRTATPRSYSATAAEMYPQFERRLSELDQRWLTETHGDDDIGKADLSSLLESVTGRKLDGDVKEFLEEMFPMMKQYK